MSAYHPSQLVAPEYRALYSDAIRHSLIRSPQMAATLPCSPTFPIANLTVPDNLPTLNFSQKLGHLYEDAFAQIIDHSTRYELIVQNLQIRDPNKITLGELDYVLADTHTGEFIHLELAIKFYLVHQHKGQTSYPGPNAQDNWQKKLQRLSQHQLTLTSHPVTQRNLKENYQINETSPRHLVHGTFFDHITATELPVPVGASPTARRARWLACQELQYHLPDSCNRFLIVPKPLWLCPIDKILRQSLVSVDRQELVKLAQQRCTLFLTEECQQPLFLTPDDWPC